MHDMERQVSTDFAATETNPQLRRTKKHHAAEPGPWGQHSHALVLAQPSYSSAHLHTSLSTQHHLHYIVKRTPSTPLHHQTQHHQHTHTIYTTSSTQHHQQPHQPVTIYITPSAQHHLNNIIHTAPTTLHHHILAGAALGTLPSYPFCIISADTPLAILGCGLFFVLFR